MTATALVLLGLAAFAAGAINAAAGGGSLLSFPALVAAGQSTVAANVTNSVAIWPGYIGSTVAYRAELALQKSRAIALSFSALAGGVLGAVILLAAPEAVFDAIVPVLVGGSSVVLLFSERVRARAGIVQEGGSTPGWRVHAGVFASGTYGAYFGGGLGVLLLATLGVLLPDGFQQRNALKCLLSLVINSAALVAFSIFGPVSWEAVAVMAPSALAGGYAGANIVRRLPTEAVRVTVAFIGIAVAIWLAVR